MVQLSTLNATEKELNTEKHGGGGKKTGGQKLRNSCGVRKGPEQTDLKKLIKKEQKNKRKADTKKPSE